MHKQNIRHDALVAFGLGGNLKDRKKNIELAIKNLPIDNKKISKLYESKALLPPNCKKNWNLPYLNAVVIGYPRFDLLTTFLKIKNIERRIGRKRSTRWAPRIIDIDILFFKKRVCNTNMLRVPHHGIQSRYFVLKPMSDIIPNFKHSIYNVPTYQILKNHIRNHGKN